MSGDVVVQLAHQALFVVLIVAAPMLGGAVLLEVLTEVFPGLRILWQPYRPKYVFSELNEASLSLAKDLLAPVEAGKDDYKVQDDLERLVDRSLHVPLNGTLKAVEYISENECLAALDEVQQEAGAKAKMQDLLRPLADKLQADLVVVPVLTGYEQYQRMSWHRWGGYITHSYASVQVMGYDKSRDEVFKKGASRQFSDEYSTQGDVSLLAHEVMEEALRQAKIHERVWIWHEKKE